MVKHRKGAVLIIVIIFVITALISSLVLYNSVYYLAKTQGVDEPRRIREHYLASAGMTYASMLLKDPIHYAGFASDPPAGGTSVTKTIRPADALGGSNGLGLTGSEKITVKIEYNGTTQKYAVTSTYSDH
ncbi:MAG: hypothetical protein PHN63_00770 [Candidatus Omnitrophica bacterium]|nr:hypothetical protein [Candidatus Omnitrophota bacterium]